MDKIFEQLKVEFGKKIKAERETQKLTLQDMEFNTGIDFSDFSKIEQGKANITFKTLYKIAKALKKHPKDLFNFKFDFEDS
jgi:transcriptional regulator with XRE-family HTH domain